MANIGRPKTPLVVTEDERHALVRLTKRARVNRALAFRARLVLACAETPKSSDVARRYRTTDATVGKWRQRFIARRLEGLYDEPEATIVQAEVLQSIISHRSDGQPLSIEAGVVRVADALDMAKGRSRIPFESGRVSIHALSAAAIEAVHIRSGQGKVLIAIEMNNSAGLYQVDNLLRSKLHGSGLESYLDVEATIEGESEKRLLPSFRL